MQSQIIDGNPYIRHSKQKLNAQQLIETSKDYFEYNNQRRSCRDFSAEPIPYEVLENIIKTANTAPSGANKQPWTFCVVGDAAIKKQIRIAAEAEEKESYENRMSDEWLQDLSHLGTNWQKPFLEIAPYLIIVFKRSYEYNDDGSKRQNYYVTESVGLACGMLLSAIHHAGLVALTHTPSPMNFLSKVLKRPENEKPFLLIPVGYAADDCWVPDIKRKTAEEIIVRY
jgi:iodotyrosine deiodinase